MPKGAEKCWDVWVENKTLHLSFLVLLCERIVFLVHKSSFKNITAIKDSENFRCKERLWWQVGCNT